MNSWKGKATGQNKYIDDRNRRNISDTLFLHGQLERSVACAGHKFVKFSLTYFMKRLLQSTTK